MHSPQLWVVATPVGDPGDLSPRARHILASADYILAEDTRRAARLLKECGIGPKNLISFYEHNEQERQEHILELIRSGASVALISDAGTPLLADPGYRLVRACRKEGLPVSPVPGAFAPAIALSAAGIPPLPFTFLGFLPKGRGEKVALFDSYAQIPGSLVFFERKNRVEESLGIAFEKLGNRELAICRELTKTHEEFIIGVLADYASISRSLLGELTIIIGPPEKNIRSPRALIDERIATLRQQGLKPRAIAREVAAQYTGWTASEIYSMLI